MVDIYPHCNLSLHVTVSLISGNQWHLQFGIDKGNTFNITSSPAHLADIIWLIYISYCLCTGYVCQTFGLQWHSDNWSGCSWKSFVYVWSSKNYTATVKPLWLSDHSENLQTQVFNDLKTNMKTPKQALMKIGDCWHFFFVSCHQHNAK